MADRCRGTDLRSSARRDSIRRPTPTNLTARLPGEQPHTAPGISAYTVEVTDLAGAEHHLRVQGTTLRQTTDGRPFIPAETALGTAIILCEPETAA